MEKWWDFFLEMKDMKITELSPLIRRITADNSGVFTGPGTNTYLIGRDEITVIDPGPASKEHIENIAKVCGEDIKQILVTHTHNDHSPGAKLLHQRTAAPVKGMKALHNEMQDPTFKPQAILKDGDVIEQVDYTLRVIHTPGHASNHLCYFLEEEKTIFTGDHIMDGSTVVIAPPDGSMSQYIDSLQMLKDEDLKYIAPGHGDLMENPHAVVDWIIGHRMFREKKVIDAITELNRASLDVLLNKVYDDVDPRLLSIAKYSLQAHLIKLVEEERVTQDKSEFVWNH